MEPAVDNLANPYSDNDINDIMRDLLGDSLPNTPVEESNNEEVSDIDEDSNEDSLEEETPQSNEEMLNALGFVRQGEDVSSIAPSDRTAEMEVAPVNMEAIREATNQGNDSISDIDHSQEPPFDLDLDSQEDNTEINNAYRTTGSIEIDESTSRFSGADWFTIARQQIITILGVGGIGSWASFLVSRVKPKCIYLYDDDIVEMANLSGQLYGVDSIYKLKVNAIAHFIKNNSNYFDLFGIPARVDTTTNLGDIVICGFDNMEARQIAFNNWLNHISTHKTPQERKYCLFIDGRMAAESIQVFCMTGEDDYYIEKYKSEWLFNDSEADATVCSYKQTSYCAAIIGGIITNLFINFCTNLGEPIIPRSLPFLTTYEADTMYLKTEI